MPILLFSSNPRSAQNDPARRHLQGILQKPVTRAELFAQLSEVQLPLPQEAPVPTTAEIEASDVDNSLSPPIEPEEPATTTRKARIHIAVPGADVSQSEGPEPNSTNTKYVGPEDNSEPEPPSATGANLPQCKETPRRMRVLAAEDNKTNQLVFRKMVKDLPIDIKFANNGMEAVTAFAEFEPDLIFMDISMPKMDGKEATGEIRRKEAESGDHIPIIALTAHAMDGDADGILVAGLDHYMTKPLRKALIHEQIANHCPQDAEPID